MSDHEINLKPVSMYTITAKLMNHLLQTIEDAYGEDGISLYKDGISHFVTEQKEIIAAGSTPHHIEEDALFSYDRLLDETAVENTYKRFVEAQEAANVSETVSIYGMMAKAFGHIAKEIVDTYGENGEDVIREAVRKFGEERGHHIARRAASVGKPNTIENYLTHYDMGRSELFEYETTYHENEIEQTFTVCAFGDQWKADGMGKYGILYCQMIDPAIAKGYNPHFEVVHDEYILREGCCHFLFQMKENESSE